MGGHERYSGDLMLSNAERTDRADSGLRSSVLGLTCTIGAGLTEQSCRICEGVVREVLDLGQQPVSNAFVRPEDAGDVPFFRLAIGLCASCTMVQQLDEVPPHQMFHAEYPYRASGSSLIRKHGEDVARRIIETCPGGRDGFVVEIGSNDGVMLKTLSEAGIRHLGVDRPPWRPMWRRPTASMFGRTSSTRQRQPRSATSMGRATHLFGDAVSHISYLDEIFLGVDILHRRTGCSYWRIAISATSSRWIYFDQIYDEHIYLFRFARCKRWQLASDSN